MFHAGLDRRRARPWPSWRPRLAGRAAMERCSRASSSPNRRCCACPKIFHAGGRDLALRRADGLVGDCRIRRPQSPVRPCSPRARAACRCCGAISPKCWARASSRRPRARPKAAICSELGADRDRQSYRSEPDWPRRARDRRRRPPSASTSSSRWAAADTLEARAAPHPARGKIALIGWLSAPRPRSCCRSR